MTYISLPITGYDLTERKAYAEKRRGGYTSAITPFDLEWKPDQTWEWYMARCLEALRSCDTIVLCEGWEQSRGCRLERAYAEYLGLKIHEV